MTNRRKFLIECTMAAGAVTLLRPLKSFAGVGVLGESQKHLLTILHTANYHGQWLPVSATKPLAGLGGLSNAAKKIDEIKNQNPTLLLIHSGNITHAAHSRERTLSFYKNVARSGYDVVFPGSEDLANGNDYFLQLAKEGGLPAFAGTAAAFFNDASLHYSIVLKGKIKIGIINAASHTHNSRLVDAINQTAGMLKKSRHCALVVCMAPPRGKPGVIARLSSDVDLVIAAGKTTSINNTEIVRNSNNEEVIISHAGTQGTMISRIDLTLDCRLQKIAFQSTPIFIGTSSGNYVGLMKQHGLTYA